jgi:acetyl esterase/lipase
MEYQRTHGEGSVDHRVRSQGGHDLGVRRLLPLLVAGLVLAAACSSDGTAAPGGGHGSEAGAGTAPETSATAPRCAPGNGLEGTIVQDAAYDQVDGVDPNLLSLDLVVPAHDACEPPPVVVFVHGGGWRQGDKDGASVEQKRALFTDAGWAFATVNYRLSPEPHDLDDPDRVTYPTHPRDVATALAWLDDEAGELGIDASRIGLIGHSAGAGIVSTLGTDESFLRDAGLEPEQLACTVSLDTEAYDVTAGAETEGMVGLTYQNAFTTDPEVWVEASPIEHVDGDEAPFLVVTRGTPDRRQLATEFVDRLLDAGGEAELLDVSPYTHDDANRQVGAPGEQVLTPAVTAFFEGCLGGSASDG